MTPLGHSEPPFDGAELVRWAESYGHPEEWAKRAQAAHARADELLSAIYHHRQAIKGAGTIRVVDDESHRIADEKHRADLKLWENLGRKS